MVEAPEAYPFRQATVEVRRTDGGQLIAAIEIISPANKREPGLTDYQQKRKRLYQAGVHLLEIDLIRRGVRPIRLLEAPQTPYLMDLVRSHCRKDRALACALARYASAGACAAWTSTIQTCRWSLNEILATIYDEAAYDLSIDYSAPPPPPAAVRRGRGLDAIDPGELTNAMTTETPQPAVEPQRGRHPASRHRRQPARHSAPEGRAGAGDGSSPPTPSPWPRPTSTSTPGTAPSTPTRRRWAS